jgi:Trk-type K+ transport system membrane component
MQWLGGLGITVLSVAVMIQPGLAAKRLDFDEDYDDDLK